MAASLVFPVRDPQGKIRLYCKGADTLLLARLHPSNQQLMTVTSDHLNVSAGWWMTTLSLKSRELIPPSSGRTVAQHKLCGHVADNAYHIKFPHTAVFIMSFVFNWLLYIIMSPTLTHNQYFTLIGVSC